MTDKEFKVWTASKPNEIQDEAEYQPKNTSKVIQEMKEEISIFKRNQSDFLELKKNHIRNFKIQLKVLTTDWTKQKKDLHSLKTSISN